MARRDGIEELHTFDEWSAKGYRVRKGEKSCARNKDNVPLFSSEQVWCPDAPIEDDGDEDGFPPVDRMPGDL